MWDNMQLFSPLYVERPGRPVSSFVLAFQFDLIWCRKKEYRKKETLSNWFLLLYVAETDNSSLCANRRCAWLQTDNCGCTRKPFRFYQFFFLEMQTLVTPWHFSLSIANATRRKQSFHHFAYPSQRRQ
jgi:hypothetical protein